jgi:hypothetical protein
VRRGERIGGGGGSFALAGLRHAGREALVVGLDRDVERPLEFLGEAARERRLTAFLAAQVQWQADDDQLNLMLLDQVGDGACDRRLDHRQRRRQRAARVRQGATDARRAVVECEDPHA